MGPGCLLSTKYVVQETRVQSLGWEDPLEKGMATRSSILAWRIPWTEEPARLLYPWDSPGKNTGAGCHSLLQGIVPIQGLNPCFLQLLHLSTGIDGDLIKILVWSVGR